MSARLEEIPTIDEFIEGLNKDQISEGIEILGDYITSIKEKQVQAKQQLRKTPITQKASCEAHIAQCNSCIQTAGEILSKYNEKFYNTS